MKVRETKEGLATISSACTSRHDWHGGQPGSSKFSDAQTQLGSVRLAAKNPLVISTFMWISPGVRMNPGREHRAEKSEDKFWSELRSLGLRKSLQLMVMMIHVPGI